MPNQHMFYRLALPLAAASLIATCVPSTSVAQPRSDREIPGIKVGAKAPDFQLKDQDGKQQSLQQLLKKGKVALVFYRSADW